MVVPDFPTKLVAPGTSREVQLRLDIDEQGGVRKVYVESPPSELDEGVIDAARRWFVVPDLCLGSQWTQSAVRTGILFSAEGGSGS